jgi:hypothetical protein
MSMIAAAIFFVIGGLYGWWCCWLTHRNNYRLMRQDRDYWFREHEILSAAVQRTARRNRDDADWWKEEA